MMTLVDKEEMGIIEFPISSNQKSKRPSWVSVSSDSSWMKETPDGNFPPPGWPAQPLTVSKSNWVLGLALCGDLILMLIAMLFLGNLSPGKASFPIQLTKNKFSPQGVLL
jgi:hypothetical protein